MNDASDALHDDPRAAPPDAPGAGAESFLVIRGRGGLLDGELVKVPLGATVVLGRSRRCDVSLKKSARYLLSAGADRAAIRSRLAYRAVSRRHCSVRFASATTVEITNHSPNGTFVDGRAVTRLRLDDIRRRGHRLTLGRRGDEFEVEFGSLLTLPEDSISR
jgi:pSer/pThr/pTyr-binding forkhead associated (FHA) protein